MTLNWLYQLADWNPQFFRELKGRLQPRSLRTTIVASFAIQALILGYFWLALPISDTLESPYCTGFVKYSNYRTCVQDPLGQVMVNWQAWWNGLFYMLSWTMPFIVLIAGVYMLISDLGKEDRRGTLNFIRLSPQPSQSVLLGKLLGVPIVPLVAVGLAIPFHLVAAVAAGVSVKVVVTVYVLTIALAGAYFTGALLFAFLGGLHGWIGAIVVWCSFLMLFNGWWSATRYNSDLLLPDYYFNLRVSHSLGLTLAFWVVTLSVATFWFWQAVNRRYRNPLATVISKRQSYWMTLSFELWLVGFTFRERFDYERYLDDLGLIGFLNLVWFVLLMAALMPQRQALLDWARYRRQRVNQSRKERSRSLIKDLLRGEKSPAVVAIGVNLALAIGVLLPWIATWQEPGNQLKAMATIGLGCLYVLICAVITQLLMLLKTSRRSLIATAVVAAICFVPPTLLSMLSFHSERMPIAWLLSAFPLMAMNHVTALQVCLSFLAHVGVLATLSMQLNHRLKKAGESEAKALLLSSTR